MSYPDPTKTYEDDAEKTWKVSDGAVKEMSKNLTDSLQIFGVINKEHYSEVRRLIANDMKDLLKWFVNYFQVEGEF